MRRIVSAILALAASVITGMPALAVGFEVTAPTTINYDASLDGFEVTGISFSAAPAYVQVGLTLQTNDGIQVDQKDAFKIATVSQCSFDSSWRNPSTFGEVVISGDNTSNVILAGYSDDVLAAIDRLWIYRANSSFCGVAPSANIGQALLNRKLKVTAVESAPGLYWSPSTQHYYQLATQTTSDGMGQPTDDSGNITDPSRYFVRWSTARANAKSSSVTIGGNVHTGYLASITTKAEFAFLNDNVTGGRGTIYPAWVGGSDAGTEGQWKWVDGPEALKFGGDTLDRYVDQFVTPDGLPLQQDPDGANYVNYPTQGNDYFSFVTTVTYMRDGNGDRVRDPDSNYWRAFNPNGDGGYCQSLNADPYASWASFNDNGPVIETTPYGSFVRCDMALWWGWPYVIPKLQDSNGNVYGTDQAIYKYGDWGYNALDADNNYLAVEPGTSDFNQQSGTVANYEGATFWGPDYGTPGADAPDYCGNRGVRGVCARSQRLTDGSWDSNFYYIYWSNGGRAHVANWDGTGSKPGDGVYNPQPDNAGDEDALIINWCARNSGVGNNSDAVQQSLYGNADYYCTPGWNDLPAGNWAYAQNTYSGAQFDTPNQIGTTDYVIEYCGYSAEASCDANPATVVVSAFAINSASGCGDAGASTRLDVSYAAPHVDVTDLTSTTMTTETFDSFPRGWWDGGQTAVGVISGRTHIGAAGPIGGSGGTGNFPSAVDTYLTLPTTECYLGFWWSAGNPDNNVQLLDSADNVVATFTASDLVANLGACPNDYCGNPNLNFAVPNELFAFVHLRLPSGFNKVHFYGTGFELDSITLSIESPTRSANETAVVTDPVNLTCAGTDSTAAATSLVACPQAVTITAGTPTDYNPLADSQIADYTYPGDVSVADTYVYSGVGTARLTSAPLISLTSSTVGTYFVDYKITQGGVNRTSRITVTVIAGGSITMIAPQVVLADPRTSAAEFPTLQLSGAANAAVCIAQVADSEGSPLQGAPTVTFNLKPGSSVSGQWVGSSFAIAGATASVQETTNSLLASRTEGLVIGGLGSLFVRINASASAVANSDACAGGASAIVEIRPIELDASSELIALIGSGN